MGILIKFSGLSNFMFNFSGLFLLSWNVLYFCFSGFSIIVGYNCYPSNFFFFLKFCWRINGWLYVIGMYMLWKNFVGCYLLKYPLHWSIILYRMKLWLFWFMFLFVWSFFRKLWGSLELMKYLICFSGWDLTWDLLLKIYWFQSFCFLQILFML